MFRCLTAKSLAKHLHRRHFLTNAFENPFQLHFSLAHLTKAPASFARGANGGVQTHRAEVLRPGRNKNLQKKQLLSTQSTLRTKKDFSKAPFLCRHILILLSEKGKNKELTVEPNNVWLLQNEHIKRPRPEHPSGFFLFAFAAELPSFRTSYETTKFEMSTNQRLCQNRLKSLLC